MKTVLKLMICIGIAAVIMNPQPLIEINIYKNEKEDK